MRIYPQKHAISVHEIVAPAPAGLMQKIHRNIIRFQTMPLHPAKKLAHTEAFRLNCNSLIYG
jgi:hypothetical protein